MVKCKKKISLPTPSPPKKITALQTKKKIPEKEWVAWSFMEINKRTPSLQDLAIPEYIALLHTAKQ